MTNKERFFKGEIFWCDKTKHSYKYNSASGELILVSHDDLYIPIGEHEEISKDWIAIEIDLLQNEILLILIFNNLKFL